MILTSLELTDFRNYSNENLQFGENKNYFVGKNAQGKTNLLEAIYLLCLSKSFRTNFEKEAIRFSHIFYNIKGTFKLDNGNQKNVIFHCSEDKGKQIKINRKRLNRISDLIGNFPVVLSSPDEYVLTLGPPPGRRRFVDIILSQMNKKYFSYLQNYHRTIKQRNAILSNWKISGVKTPSAIEPWDQRLVETGSNIIAYRRQFSKSFSEVLKNIYSELVGTTEVLKFDYRPNIDFEYNDEFSINFLKRLQKTRYKEIQRGTTLSGPHRDDFIFSIDEKELRKFGSRGQHKTVLIALAFAQFNMIKEKIQENPIILVDDLFSEIDNERETKIIDWLSNLGQVFITTTSIHNNNFRSSDDKYFYIENGTAKEYMIDSK